MFVPISSLEVGSRFSLKYHDSWTGKIIAKDVWLHLNNGHSAKLDALVLMDDGEYVEFSKDEVVWVEE